MEATADIRLKQAELDIVTLRTTQNKLLDKYDEIYNISIETRDIAANNRERLGRVEERLELLEEVVLENRTLIRQNHDMIRENRDMIRENRDMIHEMRTILFMIADQMGLTYEKPAPRAQPD